MENDCYILVALHGKDNHDYGVMRIPADIGYGWSTLDGVIWHAAFNNLPIVLPTADYCQDVGRFVDPKSDDFIAAAKVAVKGMHHCGSRYEQYK